MSRSQLLRCVLVPLAISTTVSQASGQFFSQPAVTVDWLTQQTARTLHTQGGSLLCESPWNTQFTHTGANFEVDDLFAESDGGCPLVTLRRTATFAAVVAPASSASISLVSRIEANTITEIERRGSAVGSMLAEAGGSFRVDRWCTADVLLRFIADAGRQAAVTSMTSRFIGPIDPATGEPVLIDESWSGSTREVRELDGLLLAPGMYELRAQAAGTFLSIVVQRYTAQTTAEADLTGPANATSPTGWDLDGDGLVRLSDACLWAEDPSDVDGDGDIQQTDLAFLMALARAAGDNATDLNGDGVPDQCGEECPADFNSDGLVDFFDVQGFLGAFASGNPAADMNGDTILDFFDLLAFLGLFSAGC